MRIRSCVATIVFGLVACSDPAVDEPVGPSAAAKYRGYAAVQDDLYAKFVTSDTPFELFRYLGNSGEELSKLVGRPDGFGVTFDVRNARPNAMNAMVWRMMLKGLADDLTASCPGSTRTPIADPAVRLNARAAPIVGALCAWPNVTDQALIDAWDLTVGYLAPRSSRDAFVRFVRGADLQARRADDALPQVWLGALLHPSFLLEQ